MFYVDTIGPAVVGIVQVTLTLVGEAHFNSSKINML